MIPEEQIALAIECGADERIITGYGMTYEFNATELAAYTAAVEAKERERCAVVCDKQDGAHDYIYSNAIRNLK